MKRTILTLLIIFVTSLTALAQATQPCVVKQYNQKQQKTPLGGVLVEVRDAGSAVSAANGTVTLQFATLKPGDHVALRAVTKAGYELMNKAAVEQWNISRDQKPFELVLIQSTYFTQLKGKLKQSSVDSYHQKYVQTLAELEEQKKAGKLKEVEYNQRLDELEERYQSQLQNLDAYVDQFARIDLSELSEQEQQFVELAHAGRLDEAAEAYNSLNAARKYITAVENVKRLNEDIAKLEEEKARQQEAANAFFAVLQRQVNTLKLAGGEENYRKAGELLKRAALADTTDIDKVWVYALFAHDQHDFKEAEQFWLICLNGSKGNLHQQALFQNNLGMLYYNLRNYAKAEEYFLFALGNLTQLFNQSPDEFCVDLAGTQNNLGTLYHDLHDFVKAEEYFLHALENYTLLFKQAPDTYRTNLALAQNNLGIFYINQNNNTKAEEYFILALENYSHLFTQDPDTYRSSLAVTQNNLGNFYRTINDFAKAEEYYIKTLENRSLLFTQNPNAFRADLASTQYNLGLLYFDQHNHTKAEEYYLKALENYTQLFSKSPDAYRDELAKTQYRLGEIYHLVKDDDKAMEYYLKALENQNQLFALNPDIYQAELAVTQFSLGIVYSSLHDYAKAEVYYKKALENHSQLFASNPDIYRANLTRTQYNMGNLYWNLQAYAKAEEYYLKAFDNFTLLFAQAPDAYRTDLASTQYNLGLLYSKLNDYTKAEDYYLKSLENKTLLFLQHPDANRADLANTQYHIGNMYWNAQNYAKAEEYYFKALENYKLLSESQPESYRENLAWVQYSLVFVYSLNEAKLDQYDAMLDLSLANFELLYQNDNQYQSKIVFLRNLKGWRLLLTSKTDEAIGLFESTYKLDPKESVTYLSLGYNAKAYEYAKAGNFTKAIETIDHAIALVPAEANLYDSKGEILLMKGDEQEAMKMWQKVLELDPDFLKTHDSELYKQLKEKGIITE